MTQSVDENLIRRVYFTRALTEVDEDRSIFRDSFPVEFAAANSDPDWVGGYSKFVETRIRSRQNIDLASHYRRWEAAKYFLPLVLLCFVLGFATNLLGQSRSINLLSNPFVIVLIWNLGSYLAIIYSKGRRIFGGDRSSQGKEFRATVAFFLHLSDRLSRLFSNNTHIARLRVLASARIRFFELFYDRYGSLLRLRFWSVMHLMAAVFMIGVLAGMYQQGFVQKFNFVWDSTFIRSEESLRQFLEGLFAPVLFLTQSELPILSGDNGAAWINLTAKAAALYVVGPRLLLFLSNRLQLMKLNRNLQVDTREGYFRHLAAHAKKIGLPGTAILYSFTPDDATEQYIRQLTSHLWAISEIHKAEWGDEELPADLPIGLVVCFNGTQVPEIEVHGHYLQLLKQQLEERDGKGEILVLVDLQSVDEAKVESTKQNWNKLMHDIGLELPAMLDLSADVGHKTITKMAEHICTIH